MRTRLFAATAALALVVAAPLGAATTIVGNLVTVSFDDDPNGAAPPGPFGHGRIITNEYTQGNGIIPANSWLGFTIHASKDKNNPINPASPTMFAPGIPHFAVLYNSGLAVNGADTDLQRSVPNGRTDWDGGNLVGQNLGNLLIIQENAPSPTEWSDRQLTGVADNAQNPTSPDDNANGGRILFDFDASIKEFSWNWADLDEPSGTYVRFVDTKTGVFAQIDFRQFSDAPVGNPGDGDYYERLGVDWAEFGPGNGDGYANSFTAVTITEIAGSESQPDSAFRDENTGAAGFQLVNTTKGWRNLVGSTPASAPASFDEVEFFFGGSGGLALIAFEVVPEPSTYAALAGAAALVGVVIVRRRRR